MFILSIPFLRLSFFFYLFFLFIWQGFCSLKYESMYLYIMSFKHHARVSNLKMYFVIYKATRWHLGERSSQLELFLSVPTNFVTLAMLIFFEMLYSWCINAQSYLSSSEQWNYGCQYVHLFVFGLFLKLFT